MTTRSVAFVVTPEMERRVLLVTAVLKANTDSPEEALMFTHLIQRALEQNLQAHSTIRTETLPTQSGGTA